MMAAEHLLRLPQVRARVGLGRSSIYAAISAGEFPRPVSIGARAIAWPASSIDEWIESKVRQASKPHKLSVNTRSPSLTNGQVSPDAIADSKSPRRGEKK